MLDLDDAIRQRHSSRNFLPTPVPRELVNEALALAQLAPSNSNIQPWRVVFVSGAARQRLVAALVEDSKPALPLPAQLCHKSSNTCDSSLDLKSTAGWGLLGMTKPVARQLFRTTTSSSTRRWRNRLSR